MNSCVIDLRALHAAIGGHIVGNQVLCAGPGHSKHDRSLAVKPTASGGFIVHSFAGDDWRLCQDYVRERLGLPRSHRDRPHDRPPLQRTQPQNEKQNIERAKRVWDEGCDPRGTPAEQYIASRKLDLPAELCGSTLRYHPRCPWRTDDRVGFIPCLIAAFTSIATDEVTAITRIRLDRPQRWPKVERKMIGEIRDSAIKLDPIAEGRVCVAEGVETALAARQLGFSPVWALGSARRLMPIDDVDELIILAEFDGGASRKAANGFLELWQARGKKVMLALPASGKGDFNDVLMARTC